MGDPLVWEGAWTPQVTLRMLVGSGYVGSFPGGHETTHEHAVEEGDGAAARLNSPQEP